jgi:hypothetical protein
MCLATIDNYPIPQSQTRLLNLKKKLKKELQDNFGKNIKRAYGDKTGRNMIFHSMFFQKVCSIDIILDVMDNMNKRKHVHYRKWTNRFMI